MFHDLFIVVFSSTHNNFRVCIEAHMAAIFKQVQRIDRYMAAMVEQVFETPGVARIGEQAAACRGRVFFDPEFFSQRHLGFAGSS